jgi:heterodisulfide reductase subunit A
MGLAEVLDVELDENGFIKTGSSPVETSRDGIFVCGFAENPKDIPESVAQASGAAAKVASLLHSERKTLTEEVELSPEKEVVGTEPRVGAFICHCGINIGGVVDVPMVTEYVKMLPNVVYTEENLYICSEEAQDCIKRAIKEQDLNRVVVAGCTPRTHETLFRNTCAEAGLNPYLFEFANIREHCSWVHMYEPELATEKAKDLIRMTIAKAKLLEPLKGIEIPVEPAALVIGGGVSGLTAAIDIAEQGFGVHLIEKEEELGGLVNQLYNQVDGVNPKEIVDDLIKRVELNDVTVHKNTKLKELSGFVGNFRATLDDKAELNVGAIIVAIGANELKSEEYGYGETENVITLLDLEKKLKDGFKPPDDITFLLCVGCRNEEHPYCSRYCCNAAIKNVLLLKELNPNASIKVMHRDIRTYGEYEKYYTKAIEQGVTFIRYEDYPRIEPEKDKIRIRVKDILSDLEIEEYSDLFVLVTPLVPQEDVEELSKMLKVPLNENGFFLEAHVKLRPVEFATDGIFLCGTCHSPKMMEESITQASGAASHASITLSKGFVAAEAITSSVDEEKCIGCGVCESVCPYGAIEVVENIAKVTEVKCKGCGCCGSSCIKRAITMRHFSDVQLMAQARASLA